MKHKMILDKVYPSGNQVWYCSICNRRIMLAVEPANLIVIENGNVSVSHYGSTDGLRIASVEAK